MNVKNSKDSISINEVKERLFKLIEVDLAIDSSTFTEETEIKKILQEDITTDYVEFIMSIENEFEIHLDNETIQNANNIEDLINIIYTILKNKEKENQKK